MEPFLALGAILHVGFVENRYFLCHNVVFFKKRAFISCFLFVYSLSLLEPSLENRKHKVFNYYIKMEYEWILYM